MCWKATDEPISVLHHAEGFSWGGGGLVAGPRPQTSLLSGMVAVNEFLESLKVVNSLTKMFGVLGCSLPVSRILFEGTQLRL